MSAKRPRTTRTSQSAAGSSQNPDQTPTIRTNWNIVSTNRYLFIDDKAFQDYTATIGDKPRSVAKCYYLNQVDDTSNKLRLYEPEWDALRPHLQYLGCKGLLGCTQPYNPDITRLFYANLRMEWNDNVPTITSYICGTPIELSYDEICQELNLNTDGLNLYVHRSWPRIDEIQSFEKYHEFFYCWRDYGLKQFSAVELPARHRLLFLVANHILCPKAAIKTNVELRDIFLLRSILEKTPPLSMAYTFFTHMDKAARTLNMSLPYAHVISYFLTKKGIPPTMCILNKDNTLIRPSNLIDTIVGSGWVRDSNRPIAFPDPEFARNRYICLEGAKVNQYAPIGQEPTGSLRGANVPTAPQPTVDMSGFDTRLTNLENNWTAWKLSDDEWKKADQEWKQASDARVEKCQSDLHTFWGKMRVEFKKTRASIRKGSSSSAGPGEGEDEWSADED